MKCLLAGLLLVAGTMLGCSQNYFNVPADNFAEKVKVLGVAPILIDADSEIIHPQKELLIPLVTELNRKYEPLLVRKLQGTANFFAVTLLADDPKPLFSSLMARREKRDDADIQYNKYFWKNDAVGAYIKKNRLDAVMLIVVNGLTKTSKIYSSSLLNSLETNYNYLTMTAQILDAAGTVLWEYPNFRGRLLTYYPLVNLQYPDFSESEANQSRKTELRFKTLEGIRRTLEQKKSDILFRETQEPEVYGKLFDEMVSLIKHDGDKKMKDAGTDGKKAPAVNDPSKPEIPAPVEAKPVSPPVKAPAPVVDAPVKTLVPEKPGVKPDTLLPASNEIVPATESTK